MVSIVGKYEFDQSDVKDDNDYLKSLGVGLVLRKVSYIHMFGDVINLQIRV